MFDLIKARYESSRYVDMRTPAGEEAQDNDYRLRQALLQSKTNYPILALNLILFICSLALVAYGAAHLNECPLQKKMSIGLMTIGVLFCAARLLNVHHEFLEAMDRPNLPPKSAVVIWLTLLIQIAIFALFLATCYWVYSIKIYNKEGPHSPFYCKEDYHKNILWGITIALISVASIFILACTICYLRLMKRTIPAANN